jgi:hypothetical protein|tara:strand:+ start:956 stop:1198 length:243 start_codon:yes stop_codon:yes gene_type:complete
MWTNLALQRVYLEHYRLQGCSNCWFIIGTATLNIAARHFAMILLVAATYGVNELSLAWIAGVLGQANEKKAVVAAIYTRS